MCSTTDSSSASGTTGLSSMPLQSDHARLPSGPNRSREHVGAHLCDGAHRVQAESMQLGLHAGGDGQ